MDKAQKTSIEKIKLLAGLICCAMVFFIAMLLFRQLGTAANQPVELSTLVKEAETVSAPKETVVVNHVENHKVTSATVSTRYKTLLPRANVSQHYLTRLKQSGWHKAESDNGLIDSYCKGSLQADLEFNPEMNFYTFSVVWRQRPKINCGA